MTLNKLFTKELLQDINTQCESQMGVWTIAADGKTYTVKVKYRDGKTVFQVKDGRNIVARYELVMVEI